MGADVPLLAAVRLETKISLKYSKGGKYRYAYIRIPAAIKALVEGRSFKVERKGDVIVYKISEPGPDTFKPVKFGSSLYLRLPVSLGIERGKAVIELLPDGLAVHLR